jgi:hypothetical protein
MKIVQTIQIGTFTINSIGGSSIIQIGSSGMIQAHSESYETTEVTKKPELPAVEAPPEMPEPINGVQVEIPELMGGVQPQTPQQ